MKIIPKKTRLKRSVPKLLPRADERLPLLEHVNELRRRVTYVALSVITVAIVAGCLQQQIVSFLLRPAHGQSLIYTTPGGGIDFLFKVCLYTGVIASLPVIIYQILKYLEPLVGDNSVRFTLLGSVASAFLAIAGMVFGYYAGMPATLHFLFHQFVTPEIHPMITIQSYLSFMVMYMVGAALLFQVPLVMVTINKIIPLQPRMLWKKERWMILCAFILAVIMNPTPNIIDQLMLAGPMILSYQIGIGLIALINRRRANLALEPELIS